jgi:hypothetical protein
MHAEYAYDNTQYDEHDDPVSSISIIGPSISQSLINTFHDIQSSLVDIDFDGAAIKDDEDINDVADQDVERNPPYTGR